MSTKVWLEVTGGTLRAIWRYNGKPEKLSLDLPNDKLGRVVAERRIAEIRADLISGHYDTTKLKYKPRHGENGTEVCASVLFEKYAKHRSKERELSHSSQVRLKSIASKLKEVLGDTIAEKVDEVAARKVVEAWSESASPRTIKERLFDLKACWEWAKGKYHIEKTNPWSKCLDLARLKGKSVAPKRNNPFSISELETIITAFADHSQHSHYTDFVIFLSNTTCRPGEVAALRWENVALDRSSVWIGESISRGHQNAKGTKTGVARTIYLPPAAQAMLIARFEAVKSQPSDLVFTAPKGRAINDNNFRNRVWNDILLSCGIDHRPPYNLRHTAISHALANGANPVALAEQNGHSVKTLFSTYAHAINHECLFVNVGER